MPIILEIKESSSQLLSGIPEYIEAETSIPSTVFYTFNGDTPDEDSYIADGKIYLPADETSFTFKAVAISGEISSSILEEEYSLDKLNLSRGRAIEGERITIMGYDDESVDSLSFDSHGNIAQESSIAFQDLDIKSSTTDRHGYSIPGGSTSDLVVFPEVDEDSSPPYQGTESTPNNNVNFDPNAGIIIIDGRTDHDFSSQEVRIINRSSGTINVTGDYWNEHLTGGSIVSGNLVRSMFNPSNNTIVYYYYESRENRWVESRQTVSIGSKSFTPARKEGGGTGIVFRWLDSRYSSRLY